MATYVVSWLTFLTMCQQVQPSIGRLHGKRGDGYDHRPVAAQSPLHRCQGEAGLRRARDSGRRGEANRNNAFVTDLDLTPVFENTRK